MELLDIMKRRRSVRKFTGERISDDMIDTILKAGMFAPSAKNIKPVSFIVIRDKATLAKLSESRPHGTQHLKNADCAIVVLGDTSKSDVWTEDCCIAMTQMHLMADALGIGSVWIQGRLRPSSDRRMAEDFDRELLGFPKELALEAVLCLGMPDGHPAAHTEAELDLSRIHREKF